MSSRDRKQSEPYEKPKHRRHHAISSSSGNTVPITKDATKHIGEFKDQQEETVGASTNLEVNVQNLDKGGFRINVHAERNCPGLLVWILEAFEELGLDVSDARVSCEDSFHLEAVGREVYPRKGKMESMLKE
ncbi:hypothetical protein SAY87_031809 [Trapa incisa]|uniref:Plant bHLH transcription factor ACT-like domain-containing protein n=1 Tax=Trapa incisa TaxID=236973 RepID=A0AAN7KYE7_9MYRT|nr:hypothetical protein SAY87_031809 [Trapa incisa]